VNVAKNPTSSSSTIDDAVEKITALDDQYPRRSLKFYYEAGKALTHLYPDAGSAGGQSPEPTYGKHHLAEVQKRLQSRRIKGVEETNLYRAVRFYRRIERLGREQLQRLLQKDVAWRSASQIASARISHQQAQNLIDAICKNKTPLTSIELETMPGFAGERNGHRRLEAVRAAARRARRDIEVLLRAAGDSDSLGNVEAQAAVSELRAKLGPE
jgi:hypothetical protein